MIVPNVAFITCSAKQICGYYLKHILPVYFPAACAHVANDSSPIFFELMLQ